MKKKRGSKDTIMRLVKLPVEVGAEILSYLDTKTLHNLYECCDHFRNAAVLHKVRECKFSLNNLATAQSFNSDFFMDISRYLRVLNLSGVHDLTMSSLIPALKDLNKLEALDVSYTDITMTDYLEIAKVRPKLKTLSINFSFLDNDLLIYHESIADMKTEYQQAFKTLENVHFVGHYKSLLHSNLSTCILDKANVHSLKLTVSFNYFKTYYISFEDEDELKNTMMTRLSQVIINFVDKTYNEDIFEELPIQASFDTNNYEVLSFASCAATPLVKDICVNLGFHVESLTFTSSLRDILKKERNVILWNKERNRFDDKFNSKLLKILKEWMKFEIEYENLKPVPAQYKWCRINICTANHFFDEHKRLGDVIYNSFWERDPNEDLGIPTYLQTVLTLNIDKAIKHKENVKLRLSFRQSALVGRLMIKKSGALKNITHLSLFGNVNYCLDFFYNLFACCDSLVTLEIIQSDGSFSSSYLEFLPQNKVLKNIFIVGCEMDFFALFKNLSKCSTLENIHLVDTSTTIDTLPSPNDLFMNCNNLYNICIVAYMYDVVRERMFHLYKKVRSQLRKYAINVVISSSRYMREYNPYDYDYRFQNFNNPFLDIETDFERRVYISELTPYDSVFNVIR